MILAGDIGGTKTNIAVFSVENGRLVERNKKTYPSKNYPSLEAVLKDFTAENAAPITAASFGVAGPVVGETVKTPNLPWFVDGRAVARALGLKTVALLNDLEAAGYGAGILDKSEFKILNAGSFDPQANMGFIAAGTGLGEAILYPVAGRYRVLASEGGHADYAARTALEIEMLAHLAARFGHVSYERVVSGPGLVNIYNFLKDSGRFAEPQWLKNRLAEGDPAAAISHAGLVGEAEICVEALDLFVSSYGAEAGNLALRAKALGGVYVGGGIAPKIVDKLADGAFMRAFIDKGRYAELLARVPVQIVLNDEAALRGAAYYGAHYMQEAAP
ncbi:MAG TPA: glucokinase [Verrucomicrobiae bacterium]|jgi:glucokinase|nr:glucokinase [Verrucomicrobiae bacterium]